MDSRVLAAFDDIAASLGGGGEQIPAALGADVRTLIGPSSGIVDKLSAYGAKAEAATNSLPWLRTVGNNSPVSNVPEPLPDSRMPMNLMLMLGVGIVALLLFRGR